MVTSKPMPAEPQGRLVDNLRRGFAKPIAHRGLFERHRFPENSLEAFLAARDCHFAAECDVRLAADGDVYVFHDDGLERLTGASGDFGSASKDDVAALKLQGTASHVPKLSELLDVAGSDLALVIELKSFSHAGWDTSGRLEARVLEVLQGFQGVALLKSFNPHSVENLLRAAHPWPVGQIACSMRQDGDFPFLHEEEARRLSRLETDAAYGAHFISYGIADLDEGLRFSPRHGQKPWMTWTVRTPEQLVKAASLRCQVIFERPVLEQVLKSVQASGESTS